MIVECYPIFGHPSITLNFGNDYSKHEINSIRKKNPLSISLEYKDKHFLHYKGGISSILKNECCRCEKETPYAM